LFFLSTYLHKYDRLIKLHVHWPKVCNLTYFNLSETNIYRLYVTVLLTFGIWMFSLSETQCRFVIDLINLYKKPALLWIWASSLPFYNKYPYLNWLQIHNMRQMADQTLGRYVIITIGFEGLKHLIALLLIVERKTYTR
jgi:hypothetical protein